MDQPHEPAEFREIRRLQRWGHLERGLYVTLLLLLVTGVAVHLWRELHHGT